MSFGNYNYACLVFLKFGSGLLEIFLNKVYNTGVIRHFLVKLLVIGEVRLDVWLLDYHALGRGAIVGELVFHMLIVISPNLHKTANLIKRTCHVEIFKGHSWLKECLKLKVTENDFLLHAPIAKIGVPLVYASPDLQPLINHPDALIFAIL